MDIKWKCEKCGVEFHLYASDVCESCHIPELIQKKKLFWYGLKKFTYFVLLFGVPGAIVGYIYDVKIQILFYAAITLGQISDSIVNWLARKF